MQEPKTLYGKYVLEREGRRIIEEDGGFATFITDGELCYIVDMFVDLTKRYRGLGTKMADEISGIARDEGCKWLFATVDPTLASSTMSMQSILVYGFTLSHIKPPLIFFKKKLG